MTAKACPQEFDPDAVPMISEKSIGACCLCGSSYFEPFAVGYDYEMQTCINKWHFRRCVQCQHVQLDPRPDDAELAVIYPTTYYSYTMSDNLSSIALRGKDLLDRLKLKGILRHLRAPLQSYLDIGCGDGRYLRSVEVSSNLPRSRIYGLELSKTTVDKLCGEGFNVSHGRIETCGAIAPGSISLATMFHVVEHVADPMDAMAKVSAWLAPGGIIAIETPNLNSLDAKLFKSAYWGGYHFPRHWHLFDEKTLVELARKNGIEPVHVGYQTGHSFWMYSFHHLLRYRLKLVRLSRLFDPMKGLLFLILFTGFDKARAAIGMKTSSILFVGRKI